MYHVDINVLFASFKPYIHVGFSQKLIKQKFQFDLNFNAFPIH